MAATTSPAPFATRRRCKQNRSGHPCLSTDQQHASKISFMSASGVAAGGELPAIQRAISVLRKALRRTHFPAPGGHQNALRPPHQDQPCKQPHLSSIKVTVCRALTHVPKSCPVSAQSPEGMSTASTLGLKLIHSITDVNGSLTGPFNPVPNKASTTTSCLPNFLSLPALPPALGLYPFSIAQS